MARGPGYDWFKILTPGVQGRTLVRGKDFRCTGSTFAGLMREQAVKHRLAVTVRSRGDQVTYSVSRRVVEFLPYPK